MLYIFVLTLSCILACSYLQCCRISDIQSPTRLERAVEYITWFCAVFWLLAFTPGKLLLAALLILFFAAAIQDYKTSEVDYFPLLAIALLAIVLSLRQGRTLLPVLVTAALCIQETCFEESDVWGGADSFILLSMLALFGFGTWLIFVVLACCIGLLQKVYYWIKKSHETEDHSVRFLPSMLAGAIIACVIDYFYGEYYQLTIADIKWVFRALF